MESQPSASLIPPAPATQPSASLPGVIALLREAMSIYKERAMTFLGIMVAPLVFNFLLTPAILSGLTKFGMVGIRTSVLAIILASAVSVLALFAMFYAVKDREERIGVIESYRRGLRKIPSFLWIYFLMWIITLGATLLFLVPGIIFFVLLSIAPFIVVTEDLKGMSALLKSWEYIAGNWWTVFWRYFCITALFIIVSILLEFILTSLGVPSNLQIGRNIVSLLWTPLSVTYLFLVYTNLKAKKDQSIVVPVRGKRVALISFAILGALIFPLTIFVLIAVGPIERRADDVTRHTHMQDIQSSLELYASDNGHYPASLNDLMPKYLQVIPVDPTTKEMYQYELFEGVDYALCVRMETKTPDCVFAPKK